MEEPTEEMLSAIMKEGAEDARKRSEEANKRFFEELHRQGDEIKRDKEDDCIYMNGAS